MDSTVMASCFVSEFRMSWTATWCWGGSPKAGSVIQQMPFFPNYLPECHLAAQTNDNTDHRAHNRACKTRVESLMPPPAGANGAASVHSGWPNMSTAGSIGATRRPRRCAMCRHARLCGANPCLHSPRHHLAPVTPHHQLHDVHHVTSR